MSKSKTKEDKKLVVEDSLATKDCYTIKAKKKKSKKERERPRNNVDNNKSALKRKNDQFDTKKLKKSKNNSMDVYVNSDRTKSPSKHEIDAHTSDPQKSVSSTIVDVLAKGGLKRIVQGRINQKQVPKSKGITLKSPKKSQENAINSIIDSSDEDSVESFLDEARPLSRNKSSNNLSSEFVHSSDDESRPIAEEVKKALTNTESTSTSAIPTADQKLVEAENNLRNKKSYKCRNVEPPNTIYAINKSEKLGLEQVSSLVSNIKPSNLDLNGDFRLASQKMVKDVTNTYNKGEFSIQERKMIDDAINKYLVTYGVPRSDLPYLTHPHTKQGGIKVANPYKNTEILKSFFSSIQSLSKVNRTQKQVYWFIRIAYNVLRPQEGAVGKGHIRWTEEEDRELLQNCLIKGVGNWVEIDHALARIGSKDRFKNLQSRNKGPWLNEEDQCLIKHGKAIMERDGIADPRLFNSWTELCARLGNDGFEGRITTECILRWLYLGPQLSREGKCCGLEEYKDLITKMMASFEHAVDESEVHWKSIVSANDTVSGPMLSKRWKLLKSELAKTYDLSDYTFAECVKLAYENINKLAAKLTKRESTSRRANSKH